VDPAAGAITNPSPQSTYFTVSSAGVLSYTPPPGSFMNGNAYMDVNYKVRATMNQFPSKTLDNYFTINLNSLCATYRLDGASTQAAINYEDGSNTSTAVTGFTYTSSTTINADCNITH
jgi:hypothetical protein